MARNRPITPDDVARGERFAALRKTRWSSQQKMADATGIDRTRILRLESGEDRFTSGDFQEAVAAAFEIGVGPLVEYARGARPLEELLGRADAPARTVEYEERYPSRAPVLAAARAKGVDPAIVDAVAAMSFKADEDPGEDFWFDQLAEWKTKIRRLDALASDTFDDTALVAPAPAPLALPPAKRKR